MVSAITWIAPALLSGEICRLFYKHCSVDNGYSPRGANLRLQVSLPSLGTRPRGSAWRYPPMRPHSKQGFYPVVLAGFAASRGTQLLKLSSVPSGCQPCSCAGPRGGLRGAHQGCVPRLPAVGAGLGSAPPTVVGTAAALPLPSELHRFVWKGASRRSRYIRTAQHRLTMTMLSLASQSCLARPRVRCSQLG